MATKKKARRKSSKIGKGVGSVELGRAEIGLAKGIHHILIGDQGRFSKIFVFTSGQNDLVYKKMLDWGLTHPADVVLFPDPSIEGYRAHKDSSE